MKRITVLVADDHTIVREGLRRLLETAADIEIVAEARNGHEALQQAAKLLPDIVLLDIAMPQLDGIDAARLISKKVPAARVLILSAYNESREVHAALEAGAAGFVMKHTAATELLRAIRETSRGNAFFTPAISNHLLDRARNASGCSPWNPACGPSLTPRETEVLHLIVQGYSNRKMASLLSISISTVKKHRDAVMKKTRTHETATLTRYAIARGLVVCERPCLMRKALSTGQVSPHGAS